MKKYFLLVALSFFIVQCKPNATVVNTKLDNKSEAAIKGDWVISDVTYPGSDYFKVTSFSVADSNCFIGSQWNFVSNNNKGTMQLTDSKCTAYSSSITWYINKDGDIVLKFLTEGVKSKHTTSGYVLKIVNTTEQSFELIDRMNVAGQMKDIVYHFKRV